MSAEMCFWTGPEWIDRQLPIPLDKNVFFKQFDAKNVFARKFSGFAISRKDWSDQIEALGESLKRDGQAVDETFGVYTVGYDR